MADVDPCSRLVHCSFCSLVNCSDDFFFELIFQSFKLIMGLRLLIVGVLI